MSVSPPGEDTDHLSTGELLGQWLNRTAGQPMNGQAWLVANPLDRGSRFVEGPVGQDFTVIGEPRVGGQAAVARGVLSGYGEPIAVRIILASTDPKAHQRERLQVAIGQLSRTHRHVLPALVQTLGSFQISVPAEDFHHPSRLAQPGSSTVEVWAHLLQWCPRTLADDLADHGGHGLDVEEVVRRLLPVMRTLHGMHALGYIHRDLDPSNILVAEDGSLQVADFGIAVHMNINNTHTMTEAWGKQGRMPPEALQGRQVPVGPSYDAWQIGFILAEAATGARPVLPGGTLSPRLNDFPKPVRAVVRELLETNRERRLPIPVAIDRLSDWLYALEIQRRPKVAKPAPSPRPPKSPSVDADESSPELRSNRVGYSLGAMVILVFLISGFGAYRWTQTQFYIGDSDGVVAIYRGLPQDLGPITLSRVSTSSADVPVVNLPLYFQRQVEEGIVAQDETDARSIVQRLTGELCDSPQTKYSTPWTRDEAQLPTPTIATRTTAAAASQTSTGEASPSIPTDGGTTEDCQGAD